jgi:HEAT repeat protein
MTIPRSTLLVLAIAISLALAVAPVFAAGENDAPPGDKASNALYWQGQTALKQSDWSTALQRFIEMEKLLRKNEPKSVDAALYWEAYTLAQAKRTAEAKAVIERLRREFPDSRWSRDADALFARIQPATKLDSGVADDELADIALQGLLNAPPERALPLLRKVLGGERSIKTKKRALFVLSQLGTDDAMNVVLDVAKNAHEPELRSEAIRMLGISGAKTAMERLTDIYASSRSAEEKASVIQAWLVAGRRDLVLKTARDETDPALRRKAIETLGALGASDELRQLFDSTQDAGNRRAIIHSLGIAGNSSALASIAGNTSLPENERVEALHSLGIAGDHGGRGALVDLYAKANTPTLRNAVLQGLLITGDSNAVTKLYREARTTDEKKALLRVLTMMGGDTALDVIEHELDQPEKK